MEFYAVTYLLLLPHYIRAESGLSVNPSHPPPFPNLLDHCGGLQSSRFSHRLQHLPSSFTQKNMLSSMSPRCVPGNSNDVLVQKLELLAIAVQYGFTVVNRFIVSSQ